MIITRCLLALRSLLSLCFIAAFILPFFLSTPKAMEDINKISASLIVAVEERDIPKARELLSKGADVNYSPDDFPTPLLTAIALGDLEMVKLLIKNKADLDFSPENLPTPLYLAVTLDEYDIVKLLIDKGADPNKMSVSIQLNENHYLPPLYPALRSSSKILKLLIEKGANVNSELSDNKTLLGQAIYQDDSEKVKFLINAGAVVTEKDIVLSFNGSSLSLTEYLVQSGGRLSNAFIKRHCRYYLKFCIENGVKPSEIVQNDMVIIFDYDKVKYLLENGLSPDIILKTDYLIYGIDISHDSNIALKVNRQKYFECPLLIVLVMDGGYSLVKLLLEKGANPNVSQPGGETAMLYLELLKAKVYRKPMIDLLMKFGAKKDFETFFEMNGKLDLYEEWKVANQRSYFTNTTPIILLDTKADQLIEMIYRSDIKAIKKAIEDGVNLNFADDFGNTPLLAAISKKDMDIVKLLLKSGADSNFQGFIPPILGAIIVGDINIMNTLIEAGADPNVEYVDFSPVAYSVTFGNYEIARLLFDYSPNMALTGAIAVGDHNFAAELLTKGSLSAKIKGMPLIVFNEHLNKRNSKMTKLFLESKISFDVFDNTIGCGLNLYGNDIEMIDKYPIPFLNKIMLDFFIPKLKPLLANGANPNIRVADGTTPLMYAIAHSHLNSDALMNIKILIDHGANPLLESKALFSTYDLVDKTVVYNGGRYRLPINFQKIILLTLSRWDRK
jgi:ankyrin repeat protein